MRQENALRLVTGFDLPSQLALTLGIEKRDPADLVHVQTYGVVIGAVDARGSVRPPASRENRRLVARLDEWTTEFAALVQIEGLLDCDSVIFDRAAYRVDRLSAEFDIMENVDDLFGEQTTAPTAVIDQLAPVGQCDAAHGRREYSAHAIARTAHRQPPLAERSSARAIHEPP